MCKVFLKPLSLHITRVAVLTTTHEISILQAMNIGFPEEVLLSGAAIASQGVGLRAYCSNQTIP